MSGSTLAQGMLFCSMTTETIILRWRLLENQTINPKLCLESTQSKFQPPPPPPPNDNEFINRTRITEAPILPACTTATAHTFAFEFDLVMDLMAIFSNKQAEVSTGENTYDTTVYKLWKHVAWSKHAVKSWLCGTSGWMNVFCMTFL